MIYGCFHGMEFTISRAVCQGKAHEPDGGCRLLAASLFSSFHRRFFKLGPHLGLEPAEAVGLPVDELGVLGEGGVHFVDFLPHLLSDKAVIGVALRHRAQLAEMDRFAQVHLHVPADLERERDDILRFGREVAVDFFV